MTDQSPDSGPDRRELLSWVGVCTAGALGAGAVEAHGGDAANPTDRHGPGTGSGRVVADSPSCGTVSLENTGRQRVNALLVGRPGWALVTLEGGAERTVEGVLAGSYLVLAWRDTGNAPEFVQWRAQGLRVPVGGSPVVVEACGSAFFDVLDVATGSSTRRGVEFRIDADVENTGDGPGTRTLELRFDGETVAKKDLRLEAGERTETTFVLSGEQTRQFEPDRDYTVTVDSGDDAASTGKYVLPN